MFFLDLLTGLKILCQLNIRRHCGLFCTVHCEEDSGSPGQLKHIYIYIHIYLTSRRYSQLGGILAGRLDQVTWMLLLFLIA